MTSPAHPVRSVAPGEQDQVPRLNQFRRDHPGITIYTGPGYWQAQIPEPSGETIITRYRLEELLDKLDTLTSHAQRENAGQTGNPRPPPGSRPPVTGGRSQT